MVQSVIGKNQKGCLPDGRCFVQAPGDSQRTPIFQSKITGCAFLADTTEPANTLSSIISPDLCKSTRVLQSLRPAKFFNYIQGTPTVGESAEVSEVVRAAANEFAGSSPLRLSMP